ncbi:MAG: cyclic nucleotide-binding protein, partial [Bacteroidetes bacterium]
DEEWNDFSSIWKPVSMKRKDIITSAGEVEKYLYFVLDGVQRSFYTDESEKDATLVFTYPYSFSGIVDSFLLQKPSKYYLETLSASKFLRTNFTEFDLLINKHRGIESWVRVAISNVLSGVLERQIELTCFSAEEKFRALLSRSSHVLNLIPHKYLASYLGIDATTFSKLLGTVKL